MAPLRLGGLSSGLDTEAILAQLLAAQRGPRVRYERQVDVAEARKSTLADIQTKLKGLGTALGDLRSSTLFSEVQSLETSDATRVSATRTSTIAASTYSVGITNVATAEQRTFTYTTQGVDSDLTVGGVATTITADSTLADAVATINADPDAKVWASDSDGKMALTWRATGAAANADTVSAQSLTGETLLAAGRNAAFTVNGTAYSSASNDTTVVPGMTLTLKAPTTTEVSITVGAPSVDKKKVADKVKAFVEAYNAANDLIRGELREDKVRNAGNRVDRGKGVLRGDAQLNGLQSQLRQALTGTFATGRTAADQLADLGVTTGAATGSATFSKDSVNGRLVVDEAKLTAAIEAEPEAVKQLLGATGNGLAQALDGVLVPATQAGGVLDSRMTSADSEIKRLRSSMTAFDERLELRERSLRTMFTRLEQGLAASQAQGAMISQRLSGR